MLSYHSVTILKIKNRERAEKLHKYLVLKNTLLNNTWVKKKSQGKFLKYFELNENENTT